MPIDEYSIEAEERRERLIKERPISEERVQKLLDKSEVRILNNTEYIKAEIWGKICGIDDEIRELKYKLKENKEKMWTVTEEKVAELGTRMEKMENSPIGEQIERLKNKVEENTEDMKSQWTVTQNKVAELAERLQKHLNEHEMMEGKKEEGKKKKEEKKEEGKKEEGKKGIMKMDEKKEAKKGVNRMNLASKFITEFKVHKQENTIEYGGADWKETAVYGIVPFSHHCSSFTVKVVKRGGEMWIGLVDAELSN